MIGGESVNSKYIIIKTNEKGSYGVGADLLEELNDRILQINIQKNAK